CFDDYVGESDARLSEVRAAYESAYLANPAVETKLYPGIAVALERLSGMGRLAVVTNKPEKISRRLLEVLGVDSFFRAVVGGDTCPRSKPDPMVLSEAARQCGLEPGKGYTVMIGDTAADIKMGRAFGASTIWCAWGYVDDPGETPDLKAERPVLLPELVEAVLRKG
ncbi:MAG TPA: HAD family hydrolase, partial [Nitrospiria bacterium]|nr:HAD family hydrolase [Nitrospiria bacterium]